MNVSQLYIYPIKSLGGVAVTTAYVTDRGFEHDRRWMLIDESDRFVSQRENAIMALLQVAITASGLKVFHKNHPDEMVTIPFTADINQPVNVQIWKRITNALLVSKEADEWFSHTLKMPVRLVYMPDDTHLPVKKEYAVKSLTSFSDGYPILLLSEASLQDLNGRISDELNMDRFRPNLVIGGAPAFYEDRMKEFNINGVHFFGVSPCQRCVVTTIDQLTGKKGKEPLKTLATYRRNANNIYFGENVLAGNTGQISINDRVEIVALKEQLQFTA